MNFLKNSHIATLVLAFLWLMSGCSFVPEDAADPLPVDTYDVVILGSGPSALVASWYLKGHKVLILETGPQAGRTLQACSGNGLKYTRRPLWMVTPSPRFLEFCTQLNLTPDLLPSTGAGFGIKHHLYFADSLLNFMSEPEKQDYNRLLILLRETSSQGIKENLLLFPGSTDAFPSLDPITMQDWINAKTFLPVTATVADIKSRDLFGSGCDFQSVLFDLPDLEGALPMSSQSKTYCIPGGMAQLGETLIRENGSTILTAVTLNGFTIDDDTLITLQYTRGNTLFRIRSYAILSTEPATVAVSQIGQHVSAAACEKLRQIRYVPGLFVNLVLDTSYIKGRWSILCLGGWLRSINNGSWGKTNCKETGPEVMTICITPADINDLSCLYLPDATIMNQVIGEMAAYFPDLYLHLTSYTISRERYFKPVFGTGYRTTISQLNQDPTLHGPFFLAGDYLVYPSLEGEYYSGYYAAKQIVSYLKTTNTTAADDE